MRVRWVEFGGAQLAGVGAEERGWLGVPGAWCVCTWWGVAGAGLGDAGAVGNWGIGEVYLYRVSPVSRLCDARSAGSFVRAELDWSLVLMCT
jgi:hypothetical protein